MEQFKMPKLPYEYNALEPHIDAKTMEIHYSKHHQTYTNNLNALVKGHEDFFKGKTIEEILSHVEDIPESIRQGVINQGGGYANHNAFWLMLSPQGGKEPSGLLATKINEQFGSFTEFRTLFSQAAISHFGSGWACLVLNDKHELEIIKTFNQDSPISLGKTPLLLIDVWEHAYYLNYQNRRPEYVEAIWNVLNWTEVQRRYEEAIKG